jgi:hypothetical protein
MKTNHSIEYRTESTNTIEGHSCWIDLGAKDSVQLGACRNLAMPANNNEEKAFRGFDGTASPQRWKFTEGDDTSEFQQHEEGEWLSFIFIIFHA